MGMGLVIERVEENIEGDLLGVLPTIAGAFHRVLLFQCTGQIVGRKDHRPAIPNPNPFELGRDLSLAGRQRAVAAGWLAERHAADVVAAIFFGGKNRVVNGNLRERVLGKQGRNFRPKRGGKSVGRADAIDQQCAATLQKLPQRLAAGFIEAEALATMHEDEVVIEKGWIGGINLTRRVVDANTQLSGRCAENVGQCRWRRIAHAGMPELGN